MNVLALDLGTRTGWAIHSGEDIFSGTWHLSDAESIKSARAAGLDRRCEGRFFELCTQLEQAIDFHAIRSIVFEDVLFSETTLQTQLWSTFRAAIWSTYRSKLVPERAGGAAVGRLHLDCLNTSTLKKASTGHGNATKDMMAAYAWTRHPDEFVKNHSGKHKNCFLLKRHGGAPVDDNEVDARLLLDYFQYLWPL